MNILLETAVYCKIWNGPGFERNVKHTIKRVSKILQKGLYMNISKNYKTVYRRGRFTKHWYD